jgi:hypothetical protein
LASCSRGERPPTPLLQITEAEATALAEQFRKAALPCDADRVSALVDRDEFRKRLNERNPDLGDTSIAMIEGLAGSSLIATKLCGWMGQVEDYKFIRLRTVDGHIHPILRRSTGVSASYHELELVRSRDDGQVRVADLYSYFKGEWISDDFATMAASASKDPSVLATSVTLQKVRSTEDDKPAEALAALDELPPRMRRLRYIQGWRVRIAQSISMDEYSKALEELFKNFPNDPSVALLQVDHQYFHHNISGALHYIDVVDADIGPDPFLDGTRAMLLAERREPGDLDLAEKKAQHVAEAEPGRPIGLWARVSVELARHHWSTALDEMDELKRRFGFKLDDAALRTAPMFKDLLETPEYTAWRVTHP